MARGTGYDIGDVFARGPAGGFELDFVLGAWRDVGGEREGQGDGAGWEWEWDGSGAAMEGAREKWRGKEGEGVGYKGGCG